MSVSDFLQKRLQSLLDAHRIVVWYDHERAFIEFAQSFTAPSCIVVSAALSILRARREAEAVYRKLNESDKPGEARVNLLLYVPYSRGATSEDRQRDPFEVFALAGTAFGDTEGDKLESIARQAMPERAEEISRLFAEGGPTLTLLDRLESVQRWPLLREALQTESPAEVIALILCRDDRARRIEEVAGCQEELLRMLRAEIGFQPSARVRSWAKIREQLGTYVLFSEFALDLSIPLPESLSTVPRAESTHQATIFSACERMRTATELREGYTRLADRVELALRLPELTEQLAALGSQDTFASEERRYLRQLREAVEQGDLAGAYVILEGRRHSVWRNRPDRALLWTVAERCLHFLETANAIDTSWQSDATQLRQTVTAYVRPNGWAELDRCQRRFEHSAVSATGEDDIASLVDLCRQRYWDVAVPIQEHFLDCVNKEGWPPEGFLRQTQIFERYVAPLLEQRAKVAFFLADSLRFEMGRDLAEALTPIGEVETNAAAAVLPTVTACGMAALMPNADGALQLVASENDFVPALGTRLLKNSGDRMRLLKERYGDRFLDLPLEELLSRSAEKFRTKLASVDLLVVRTPDPDQIAENLSSWRARKYLSDVIGEMADVVRRLATCGFTHFVISADHGHVLVHEIPPGEVVQKPSGEWPKSKRRSLLGRSFSTAPGVMILKAHAVGIQGDPEELCVPRGFKVFAAGDSYFHEGMSLQEAVVPVVVIRVHGSVPQQGKREVIIRYRSDRFTSRVIGLKIEYVGLNLGEPVKVRIEAYDGTSSKANKAGEAADCEARDERTHEVTLRPGVETPVPVLLDPDFSGPLIEVRVIDPQTGVVWTKSVLKNALLE